MTTNKNLLKSKQKQRWVKAKSLHKPLDIYPLVLPTLVINPIIFFKLM